MTGPGLALWIGLAVAGSDASLECAVGDCERGRGAAVLADGTRLSGIWDGRTGEGQAQFTDGSVVEGRWRLRPAGTAWDLSFPDDVALRAPDGSRYRGEVRVLVDAGVRRVLPWGHGVRFGTDPLRELGQFRGGLLFEGLRIEADLDAYAGEFMLPDWQLLPSSHWSFDLFGSDYEDLEAGPGGLLRGEMHATFPDGLTRFGEIQQVPETGLEDLRYRPRLVGTTFILQEDGSVREDRCTVAANLQRAVRYTCGTVRIIPREVLPERARDALLDEDLRRADALLTQLLRLAPDEPDVQVFLGRVRQIRGEHEAAQDLFSRAAFHRPDDPMITLRLGVSELALGRSASGCARIESVADQLPAARELAASRCDAR